MGGLLLGWRTVCAVELDPYCHRVLLARQRDGQIGRFPIWDDVRTFDGRPWRGHVDVISGGFPCQPFSTASRGRRTAVNLWPEMLRVVREVEPGHVIVENVAREPIEQAASDLRQLGYRAEVAEVAAACVGAPHDRPRWWTVAHADRDGESRRAKHEEMASVPSLARLEWWADEPRDLGMDDGMANRLDRLRALGNGQVPAVVRLAWETLR